jgi:hypothetical protein
LKGAGNAPSMLRAEDQGAKDQEIQPALKEREALFFFSGRHATQSLISLG